MSSITGKKTSPFAKATLVFGVIAAVPLTLICAILALVDIRRKNRGGTGLVYAGLAFAAAWAIVLALVFAGGGGGDEPEPVRAGGDAAQDAPAPSGGDGDEPATAPPQPESAATPGLVSVFELDDGDCLSIREIANAEGDLSKVRRVDCNDAHRAQVYSVIEVDDDDYPGLEEVKEQGERGCRARLRRGFPASFNDRSLDYFYVFPTAASWADGDRRIRCIATFANRRTGVMTG